MPSGRRRIIYVQKAAGKLGCASYGETKGLCAEAGRLADALYEASYKWLELNG